MFTDQLLNTAASIGAVTVGALLAGTAMIVVVKNLRIVVGTNDMDTVQSSKRTIVYGKGQPAGNVYYKWPSWMPGIGVQVTRLPISVFPIKLEKYAAYDKGRVPFIIDIIGFFRVADPLTAAERLANFDSLREQLNGILQGAIRSILASSEIEEILEGRSRFGQMFTEAVDHQLQNWGVQSVKAIELMDIRDADNSKVIADIMAKKQSLIASQSRQAIAENTQAAQTKEIDAARIVAMNKIEADRLVHINEQEAIQQVGLRRAEQEKNVGIATQQAAQEVKSQELETAKKQQAINEVNAVRAAEIERGVIVVRADQSKQEAIILAEGERQQMTIRAEAKKAQQTIEAEGYLAQQQKNAEAVLANGTATAESARLLQMAPISTQIALAKEIGQNEGYQRYLVTIKQVEANQAIGVKQAEALDHAEIKIIVNSGSPTQGLTSVRDLFTSAGGQAVGAALEGLAQTPAGAAIVNHLKNGKGADA